MKYSESNEVHAWPGLVGKVCVVTGGGSGIGADTSRLLAAAGAKVAVIDRFEDAASEVAGQICKAGFAALAIQADVGDEQAVAAAARRVEKELGPCAVLVNNAAVRHKDELIDISSESWSRVMAVNLTGSMLCAQVFARQMVEAGQGGSLVHVGSITGHQPGPANGVYGISKAALNMMSRVFALELARHRIRSNVVTPGFTHTPATDAFYSNPESSAARMRMIPLHRAAQPVDIARAIAFFASSSSDYITGQDLVVDGGFLNTVLMQIPKMPAK